MIESVGDGSVIGGIATMGAVGSASAKDGRGSPGCAWFSFNVAVVAVLELAAVLLGRRVLRLIRGAAGRCTNCGYQAVSGVCSECGHLVTSAGEGTSARE